jgi:geranylgeranyl pyrophosphate synthase
VTLPFFHYMQSHPNPAEVVARLAGSFPSGTRDSVLPTTRDSGNGNSAGVDEIVALVRDSDAISKALGEAREFAGQAQASLALFPPSPMRAALQELAEFIVMRHV